MESPPKPQRLAKLQWTINDGTTNNNTNMSEDLVDMRKSVRNTIQSQLTGVSTHARQSEEKVVLKRPLLESMNKGKHSQSRSMHMPASVKSQPTDPKVLKLSSAADPGQQMTGAADVNLGDFDLTIEGAIVDHILDQRLPQVVNQVSLSDKDYSDEINSLERLVLIAGEEFKEIEDKLKRAKQEVRSITRQIYVTDDDIIKSSRVITKLEKEIGVVTHDNVQTKQSIVEKEKELALQQELFDRYRDKMAAYELAVQAAEMETCRVYAEVQSQKEKLECVKAEMAGCDSSDIQKVLDGTLEREIEEEIQLLQQEDDKLQPACVDALEEISTHKEKQQHLKQDVEVLHKRNAAMLRRLKSQLKSSK